MTVTLIFLNLNQFGKFYSFMFKNLKKGCKSCSSGKGCGKRASCFKILFCCFHLVLYMNLCACKITMHSITVF